MVEAQKGACTGCTRTDVSITATGGLRVHAANGKRVSEENPGCPGSGQPPAGTGPAGTVTGYVCRKCGHPVQLTANDRARSHLDPRTNPPVSCDGGSDWPMAVDDRGNKTDTRPECEFGCAADARAYPECALHGAPGSAFLAELKGVVGDPGTVRDQIGTYAAAVFDVTHDFTDPETQTYGVHPGEAGDCRLPGCCTHPRGFDYGDDGNGHSGSFCFLCGAPEPEAVPGPDDWRTPADLLARMPEGIRRTAESNPECWLCGHEVTPLAESFEPDGSVRHVVWACRDNCENARAGHMSRACRPRLPEEDRLGNVDEGDCFIRHTARPPLHRLVYRVLEHESSSAVSVTVVGTGPYAGRTGELTNLSEEITCTDLDGRLRPRRDAPAPGTSALEAVLTNLSGRLDGSNPRPTPSTPPTTQDPSPVPGSKRTTTETALPATSSTSRKATASGRTATDSTSTRTVPVTDAFSTPKQAVSESDRYDRFGRYKLLHPKTGKKVAWTRATTYAKSIQDTFALSQWAQRMTLKGAALRPDIVAAVSTLDVKADRSRVNDLVEDAKKAAGNKVAANLGTALHSFTEDRDRTLVGLEVREREVPENLLPTVDAYEALLRDFGLEPVPGLIEFTTAVLQYEIAGTSDRCYRVTRDISFTLHGRTVTLYAGEYVIGDVKSGADLSYGWMEICIQLSIYAQGLNTCGAWDWGTGAWGHPAYPDDEGREVRIQVRTDVGLIPHLPVDRKTGDPLATLYAVDLDFGWSAAVLCGQVRSMRKEGNLATPLTVADVDPGQAPAARPVSVRPPTLEDKAHAVTTQAGASAVWSEAVAARTPRAEVDRLVQIMKAKLESHVEQGA